MRRFKYCVTGVEARVGVQIEVHGELSILSEDGFKLSERRGACGRQQSESRS